MYTDRNFATKKAFKDAVIAGKQVTIYQPNDMFGNPKASPNYSGTATIEGPHYPQPHKWYAQVTLENGIVTKVK